jgi:drug/metabolite transporter (DMT)-like permease
MFAKNLMPAFLAAILWALVSVLTVFIFRIDENLSPMAATFSRVLINLFFVVAIHSIVGKKLRIPWGNRSKFLWIWGFFGALTIASFFLSVKLVGAGEATLLQGVQGMLVAILAPKLLGEKFSSLSIAGSILGILGLFFLFGEQNSAEGMGRFWGLVSGLSAGFAYLVLANENGKHKLETISFYWCIVSLVFLLFLTPFMETKFSWNSQTILLLVLSGTIATFAQWLTSVAYSRAPASLVSATSYLIPALGFFLEYALFKKEMGLRVLAAAGCIFIAGACIPLFRWRMNF